MMENEPVAISQGVSQIVEAIIPVLLIFGIINWTDAQIGAVVLAVSVVVKIVAGWITRKSVYSPTTYNTDMYSTGEPATSHEAP